MALSDTFDRARGDRRHSGSTRDHQAGWSRVCAVEDLVNGRMHRVSVTPPIAVVLRDGAVHAFEDRCPHAGALLSRGFLLDDRVVCPLHNAQFRLADGEALCPPARHGISVYEAAVHEGHVYVRAQPPRRGRGPLGRLWQRRR